MRHEDLIATAKSARKVPAANILTDFNAWDWLDTSSHAGGRMMTHADWLIAEIAAFKRAGRNVFMVVDDKGLLAMAEDKKRKIGC